MPVFGLPTCLERILNPTIGSEILKGWNLYQEKYGSICVKLRFTSSDNGCRDIQGIEEHKGGTKSAPTFQTSGNLPRLVPVINNELKTGGQGHLPNHAIRELLLEVSQSQLIS